MRAVEFARAEIAASARAAARCERRERVPRAPRRPDGRGSIDELGERYRVLPPGALRAFLDEGRADVVPLAPARVTTGDAGNRLGRATQRSYVTTAYGTIELEQIVAPTSLRPTPAGDARTPGDAGAATASL